MRPVILFFMLFSGLLSVAFSQQRVAVSADFTESSLQGNFWHIADSTHQLNARQVLAIRRQGAGNIPTDPIPNLGDGNESHWVVFEVGKGAFQKYLSKVNSVQKKPFCHNQRRASYPR